MTDKYTADEQWDNGEFKVFDTADELMEALGGAEDEMSEHPQAIWIPTYGTDQLFDEWFDEPCDDGIKYIRADIAKRERSQAVETEAAVWLKSVNELIAEIEMLKASGPAIGPGERVWKCNNCDTHGIVPVAHTYVPGWAWRDDETWVCDDCALALGLW